MATFMAMEKRDGDGRDAEMIRDGFSLLAFLFPLLWLLWHRLWVEAAAYVVLALALVGLGWLLGLGDMAGLMALPLNLFAGLEASTLRQRGLVRRGWDEWGPVEAGDSREALTRYLAEAGHLDADLDPQPSLPMRYTGPATAGPALGLFAYPDKR